MESKLRNDNDPRAGCNSQHFPCNILSPSSGNTMFFRRYADRIKPKRIKGVKGAKIHEDLYDYPKCPNCHIVLKKITSAIRLTSFPPKVKFHCIKCKFHGYLFLSRKK